MLQRFQRRCLRLEPTEGALRDPRLCSETPLGLLLRGAVEAFEQGAADADEGGAFFDRDLEVAAHAHGEFGGHQHRVIRCGHEPQLVRQFVDGTEDGSGGFGIAVEGGHRHQAADCDVGHGETLEPFAPQNFGVEAVLGGFPGAIASAICWAIGLGAQDATLRSGIAQVVSMNKRGSAFGAFNGAYGVAWFAGSATMGLLYDHSLTAVVIFGVASQLIAGVMFFGLRRPLAEAAAAAQHS